MTYEKLVIVGSVVFSFSRVPAKFSRAYALQNPDADTPLTTITWTCIGDYTLWKRKSRYTLIQQTP